MTFKNLMDELSGVAVADYSDVVSFVQELKSKSSSTDNIDDVYGNGDWTVSDENWHEVEIW